MFSTILILNTHLTRLTNQMLQENFHAEDGGDHFHLEVLARVEGGFEEAAPNSPTLQWSG